MIATWIYARTHTHTGVTSHSNVLDSASVSRMVPFMDAGIPRLHLPSKDDTALFIYNIIFLYYFCPYLSVIQYLLLPNVAIDAMMTLVFYLEQVDLEDCSDFEEVYKRLQSPVYAELFQMFIIIVVKIILYNFVNFAKFQDWANIELSLCFS